MVFRQDGIQTNGLSDGIKARYHHSFYPPIGSYSCHALSPKFPSSMVPRLLVPHPKLDAKAVPLQKPHHPRQCKVRRSHLRFSF